MSRAGIVLPRLHAVAAAALATPYPTMKCFLGPIVSGDPDDAFFVGYTGDPFGDMEMVRHTQQWGAIGNKARDEEFDVHCCFLNRSGASTASGVASAIERLYGAQSVVANAIHGNPSIDLGPPTTPVMQCSIRGLASYMPLTDNGVEPRITFAVHVRTRI